MVIRSYKDIPDEWLPVGTVGTNVAKADMHTEMERRAIRGGVENHSYKTTSRGIIPSFKGEAVIEYRGKKFKAAGYTSTGTAEYVASMGAIIFTELKGGTK